MAWIECWGSGFAGDFRADAFEDFADRFAVFHHAGGEPAGAGFDEGAVARDFILEHEFGGQKLAESFGGLDAVIEVVLDHGEQDAEDLEAGVHHAEFAKSVEQLGH